MHEKNIAGEFIALDNNAWPAELLDINSRGRFPLYVENDVAVADLYLIMRFINRRFAYPSLTPADIIEDIKMWMAIVEFEQDLQAISTDSLDDNAKRLIINYIERFLQGRQSMLDKYTIPYTLFDICLTSWLRDFEIRGLAPSTFDKSVQPIIKSLFERPSFLYAIQETA